MATKFGVLKGDLIASLGELVHSGTATTGGNDNLIDTNTLNYPDDELNELWLYIHDGTGEGQERRITDFDQATSKCTVSPNWATNPDNTSQYRIYSRRFNNAAYEAAFKQALRLLRRAYPLPEEDTGIDLGATSAAASFAVNVPTGMVSIYRILREHDTLDDVFTVPLPGPADSKSPAWYLSQDGTTYKIVFDYDHGMGAGWWIEGRALKVIGQKWETEPTADDSEISINPGPIIELAAMILAARDIPNQQERTNLAYIFTSRLSTVLAEQGAGIWPGSVIVEDF